MAGYSTPVDVANRALQHVGASRITALTDVSKNAAAVNFCYDKLRRSELRRNVWRFSTRRVILRAFQPGEMMNFVPMAFDVAKSYLNGSIVSYDGLYYQANQAIAVSAVTPDQGSPAWTLYFGTLTATLYDTATVYFSGEIVYDAAGHVYLSLQSSNSVDPTQGVPAYDPTITYNKYQTVLYSATVYQSTIDLNLNNIPTGAGDWVVVPASQPDEPLGQTWLKLGLAVVTSIQIVYPLGSGPRTQSSTQNIYFLPNGFLREAPQDPKAGSVSYLGAPSGPVYSDWEYESHYFTSNDAGPIVFRFAADVADVSAMDDMFCEGLGARIGLEVCEELTQSAGKLQAIGLLYNKFMSEARNVNGIEVGSVEPPEDTYITCRL